MSRALLSLSLLGLVSLPALAAVDPRSADTRELLSRTIMSADLDGDGRAEQVVLVNRLTGRKDADHALDVQVGVYRGSDGPLIWSQSLVEQGGGPCFAGEMTLVDLEGDGAAEILVTYSVTDSPDRRERRSEVYRWERARARRVWDGVVSLDTSRDEGTPPQERAIYERELDIPRTLSTRGGTLFFTKTLRMAAGVTLNTPRVISEKVVLPPRPEGSR